MYCTPTITIEFWAMIALVAALAGLLWMFVKAIPRKEMEATAKSMTRSIVISIAVAFGVIGLAYSLCSVGDIAMQLVYKSSTPVDQFRYAETYLNILINGIGIPTILNLQSLSYSTFIWQATFRTAGGVNIFGMLRILGNLIDSTLGLIFGPIIASLNLQLISISAAQALAFTIILPAGIAASAFDFTRPGGCFLIALALGAYFVWPFFYIINYEISKEIWEEEFKPVAAPPTALEEAFPSAKVFEMVFNMFKTVSFLLMQGLVLPVVNITLLVGFIKVFQEALLRLW